MIILVYKGILIVAFVEMAGTYDRGGDNPNDQGSDLQLIFILIFRGVIDEDIDSRDHRWCHVRSVHTDTRYDHICSSMTSFGCRILMRERHY